MHILVCILITSVVTLDFLTLQFDLPRVVGLLPEGLAAIAFILALSGLNRNPLLLRPGYILLITLLLLTVAAGLIIAEATTGPLVGGLRLYGKYLPFLLLPLVMRFTEAQLRQQMLLLLGLMLLQLPVVILQRFVLYAARSGDLARGTFSSGSLNGIVLLAVIAVVIAMYHKKKLSGPLATVLCTILFLPSAIGEVKGAFVLLPLAVLLPTFFAGSGAMVRKHMVRLTLATAAALIIFAGVYSITEQTREGFTGETHHTSITDVLTDPRLLIAYLAPRLGDAGNKDRIGRIDGIVEPLIEFSGEPVKMATGLGMGAITRSPFETLSADQHLDIVESGRVTVTLSYLLWEFGVFGTLLILTGLLMLWRDARFLATRPGIEGALALGWVAVVPIYFLSMFWKNTLHNNAIMFLFAYFSGQIIARAYLARQRPLPPLGARKDMLSATTENRGNTQGDTTDSAAEPDTASLPPILNEVRHTGGSTA